jgi:glycosyltransferase involved in cell wall biosynthesis
MAHVPEALEQWYRRTHLKFPVNAVPKKNAVGPSRIVSIPIVLSDALHRGKPVIAMPIGDPAEIVEKYNCGELAHEPTVSELANAIQRAVIADASNYARGIGGALKMFNVAKSADRWIDRIERRS